MTRDATSCKLSGYHCQGTGPKSSCSCVMTAVLRAATYTAGKRLVRTLAVLRRPTGCADAARDFATPPREGTFVRPECCARLGTCRARSHSGLMSSARLTIRGLTRFSRAEFTGPLCPSPYARDEIAMAALVRLRDLPSPVGQQVMQIGWVYQTRQ